MDQKAQTNILVSELSSYYFFRSFRHQGQRLCHANCQQNGIFFTELGQQMIRICDRILYPTFPLQYFRRNMGTLFSVARTVKVFNNEAFETSKFRLMTIDSILCFIAFFKCLLFCFILNRMINIKKISSHKLVSAQFPVYAYTHYFSLVGAKN